MRVQVVFYRGGDTVLHVGHWSHRFKLEHCEHGARLLADFVKGDCDDQSQWDGNQPHEHKDPPGPLGSFRVWDLEDRPETWMFGLEFLFRLTDAWENEGRFIRELLLELADTDIERQSDENKKC